MKYFAIFKSDGSLLSFAHQGFEDLSLSNYQNYTGLIVREIPEIPNSKYEMKLVDGEIVTTMKEKYKGM